jgi:hypothetical protein
LIFPSLEPHVLKIIGVLEGTGYSLSMAGLRAVLGRMYPPLYAVVEG